VKQIENPPVGHRELSDTTLTPPSHKWASSAMLVAFPVSPEGTFTELPGSHTM